ncbi:DUF547 domain-containing protein [Catalinimonas niigatensis]|uniref:DUF547 domain-containing protein n=1 Tax=Catalinimonas niigatensis TaxID=1397264 RepID=UPI002666BF48|nr:DUF547 domain-containing protein [Catalinimonas niigatensis]WPP53206.1 DUF547 domain-containing protein [Catalinimonas niigatensis]
MKYLLIILTLATQTYVKALPSADFTQAADQFLSKHVKNGLVDYAKVKQQMDEINALYQQVGQVSLADASEPEKKAFYINAYNLIVIRQIAKQYPVGSPMDITGFFDQQKHQVAGEMLTLNELEKQKLLQPFQDARIHFVLVCAAVSCPPLASYAFTAENLEQQMEERTRLALNDPEFVKVQPNQKKVEVSQIFDWYKSDFLREAPSLLAYINQYRKEKIPASYEANFYEYNWQLNDL